METPFPLTRRSQQVMELLRAHGSLTRAEIARQAGTTIANASALLNALRTRRLVRVAGWTHDHQRPVPRFALGDDPDAPRPARTPRARPSIRARALATPSAFTPAKPHPLTGHLLTIAAHLRAHGSFTVAELADE